MRISELLIWIFLLFQCDVGFEISIWLDRLFCMALQTCAKKEPDMHAATCYHVVLVELIISCIQNLLEPNVSSKRNFDLKNGLKDVWLWYRPFCFWTQNFVGPKIGFDQKIFRTQDFWTKSVLHQHFVRPKIFRTQNFFRLNIFWKIISEK